MDIVKVKLALKEILLDLKQRGLSFAPKLAIGDGSLGFLSSTWVKYSREQSARDA